MPAGNQSHYCTNGEGFTHATWEVRVTLPAPIRSAPLCTRTQIKSDSTPAFKTKKRNQPTKPKQSDRLLRPSALQ